jgi:hypothetical protein
MVILIEREKGQQNTPGRMFINDLFFCFTIEDQDRGLRKTDPIDEIKAKKVYGSTCIPYGTYEVRVTYSPRFKKNMPQIVGVPGFDGIRFHGARDERDVEGCIGMGERDGDNNPFPLHNGPSFTRRLTKICEMKKDELIEITIR